MERVANKARVAAGTSGLSKKMRRFKVEEGLLPARSRAPRRERVRRDHIRPFNLSKAVKQFRRTGQLPPAEITVAFVRTLETTGTDGRALKRMIQAMLLREGIEPNPGPETDIFGNPECSYSGECIVGERVNLNGKKYFVCPKCAAHLTDVRGMMGRHPGGESEPGSSAAPVRSASTPLPESGKIPVPTRPVSAPVHLPPVPPSAKAASPSHPPATVVLEAKPAPLHVLDGCTLSNEDIVAVVSRESGFNLDISDIQIEEMVVPYVGERRLASVRGVQEIKAGFKAVQLSTTQMVRHGWATPLVWFGGILTVAGVLLACGQLGPIINNLQYGSVCSILGGFLVCIGLRWRRPTRRSWHIPFIPHLVSAVVAEYDRGTNVVAVRTTIRSRIARLASLPIPDRDALAFINGSELVCMQLLSHQDFFWEGAACFRQPQ